jgi:lipopolysaccharide/colanic/teichoic acid biosynthesis glycosyltransferase
MIIYFNMGFPIFFTQERIGENSKKYKIYKFRTMLKMTEQIKSDKDRLTKVGSVIRKLSIDEFPQIFNILKGDMSFIGPRPLLEKYLPFFTERELIRHNVKPGMSGLAQVSGRSSVTWDDQFEMDAVYVEKLSFILDIKIFMKTIPKVLGAVDMMVVGRIDQLPFDLHRQKQIEDNFIKKTDLNKNYNK